MNLSVVTLYILWRIVFLIVYEPRTAYSYHVPNELRIWWLWFIPSNNTVTLYYNLFILLPLNFYLSYLHFLESSIAMFVKMYLLWSSSKKSKTELAFWWRPKMQYKLPGLQGDLQ